jgi:hypothetical protein
MKLTVDDVIETCGKCGGTGQIIPPEAREAGSGTGPFHSSPNATTGKSCDRCGGKGQVLTETGRAIAAVVQHLNLYGR